MPATSPYQGNDYQAVSNFRPYELPINDIFKGITAQNQFWDAGAARVKSVYADALNLDLTLDSNNEVKKNYLKDAEKQLTKLSTMDLSDPSVQRQGFNLFKPLFKDEAIMYDNEITKTKKSIYSDAMSYRTRKLSSTGKEGEGYNERNLAFSLDGFEEFNSGLSRDPAKLKELYSKLGNKQYIPYYDPTQEYTKILNNCSGSGTKGQDVAANYLYFDKFSKTGANSSETANCFMMGLSDQAKAQIGIDGWAYYKGSKTPYADLAKDHYEFAVGSAQKQYEAIKGKIAGLEKGTSLTEEEKATLKELKDGLPDIEKTYRTRVDEYNNIVGGNLDLANLNGVLTPDQQRALLQKGEQYSKENFTTLAKGTYLARNYQQLGEAFKSDITSRELTSNASGIAQYRVLADAHAQEKEHDYRMEELQYKNKLDNFLTGGGQPLAPPVTNATDNAKNYNEQDFKNEKQMAFDKLSEAYKTVANYLKQHDKDAISKSSRGITDEFLINYAEQQSKKAPGTGDNQFMDYMNKYRELKEEYEDKDIQQKAVESIVNNQFKSEIDKLSSTKITLSDGTVITGPELLKIKSNYVETGNKDDMGASTSGDTVYEYNGKTYSQTSGKRNEISQFVNYFSKNQDLINKTQSERNDLYRKAWYKAQGFISPTFDIDKRKDVQAYIESITGIGADKHDKPNGYHILGHSKDGKDLIIIPLNDKGEEATSMSDLNGIWQKAYSTDVNVEKLKIGTSVPALRLKPKDMFADLPDAPSAKQVQHIERLRTFQTLMENQLKGTKGYASSENIKNADGSPATWGTITIRTPHGESIRIKADYGNGQVSLIPALETKSGWDTNNRTFSSPEELIAAYKMYY